jgi:aminoglycoside phosphotransferase
VSSLTVQANWLQDHVPFAGSDGYPADRPDLHGDLDGVAAALGTAMRRLHEIPIADAPLESGWEHLEQRIADNAPSVVAADLPEPYRRYTVARLLELWREGRPQVEDLVVCHGDARICNFLMTDGVVTGMEALGNLCIVDRHFDLAIIQRSLHFDLGPAAVFGFYQGYGVDPDLVRLDHFVLASLLLG